MGEWVKIFDSSKEAQKLFPLNAVKTIRIGEKRICLGRLSDGFYAIEDTCSHEGASLGKGICRSDGYVICPWHHYLFDLRTGKAVTKNCEDHHTFAVNESEDGIFIFME